MFGLLGIGNKMSKTFEPYFPQVHLTPSGCFTINVGELKQNKAFMLLKKYHHETILQNSTVVPH